MKRAEHERSLQTKNKILLAALTEFASTGFDGVSTRAIAKKAEVNHTLISHHFGSKYNQMENFGKWLHRLQNHQQRNERHRHHSRQSLC